MKLQLRCTTYPEFIVLFAYRSKKKNNKDEQYEAEKARLAEKIESLMDDMRFVPAQVNGKNVISFVNDQFSVSITDGVASLDL